jgi:HAD superfamily hydrolase (TIGR01509 family)
MSCFIPAEKLRNKKILIFDFDGTLADTTPLHARAFEETLGPKGIRVDYSRLAGRKTAEAILLCYGESGLAPPDRTTLDSLINEKQSRVRALIQSELQPLSGVDEFLRWAKPRFKLAMVTSGSRGTVELALEKLGLKDVFCLSVFGDDLTHTKPNPEGFLRVLGLVKARANEALIFEDSEAGFTAAKAAGIDFLDARRVDWGSLESVLS